MSYPSLALFINGRWIDATSQGNLPVTNPADESELGRLPMAGEKEIALAIEAAGEGFAKWSRTLPIERFRIITAATRLLRQRTEIIARILTSEQGKPLAESKREVSLAADIIDFLAEEAKRLPIRGVPPRVPGILTQTVHRVPVGAVGAFTPWNFPANLPARKLGGALAAGCSVILKPAEETPATAIEIARAFADSDLPAGVLNLIAGRPAEISKALIEDPRIAKISFTGSVRIGRQLGELSARNLKRYTAELGGHAPVILGPDMAADAVAKLCVTAKFRNAGQVCASPIRFLVPRSEFGKFRDAFVAGARALKVGPGMDSATQMGPLIHERRMQDILDFVADARAHGGRVLCGGTRLGDRGYYVAPTVIEGAPLSARAQVEEPFGPLALIDAYDTVEEAILRANAVRYGLAAYAFTRDLALAHRFQEELQVGMVGINHFGISQPETPFGGVKDSGFGQESGLEGLLAYTDVKLVSVAA
jgi:succinate-semialdehyde dehydrogenase / glutarate-semialdehyde dehydrogenase